MDLTAASWMPQQMKDLMLSGDVTIGGSSYALQMVLAIGIGIFHICLAMTIKAVLYTKRFGLKANISTWGLAPADSRRNHHRCLCHARAAA